MALVATLGRNDRQLLLDHLLVLHTLPDDQIVVVFRGRGEVGVVRGRSVADAVAAMRRALVSGYVVPAFLITNAGRRVLEDETCVWCEKPIIHGQPFRVLNDGALTPEMVHNGLPGTGLECRTEMAASLALTGD